MTRYAINPAVAPLQWSPEPYQLVRFHNPRYWNSLWLGTVWNVALLPTRIWRNIGRPARAMFGSVGDGWNVAVWVLTFLIMLVFTPLEVVYDFLLGVSGNLRAVPLDEFVMAYARRMSEREAYEIMKRGEYALLVPESQVP